VGLRKEFQKRIEKKQQEIENLKGQIREAEVYLQALQDSVKLLPKEGDDDFRSPRTLRPTSKLGKAKEAIKRAGRPLHISELLNAISVENNKRNRLSLSGSLASYVRRNEIFTRPEPNTFGLIELGHISSQEPPPGFGLPESDLTNEPEAEIESPEVPSDEDIPF
jgi:hypothetical protein